MEIIELLKEVDPPFILVLVFKTESGGYAMSCEGWQSTGAGIAKDGRLEKLADAGAVICDFFEQQAKP